MCAAALPHHAPPRSMNEPQLPSNNDTHSVVVLGAGIVGACVALVLQRRGTPVTLIDSLPPGSETSYGNAGLISVDSCIPISLPGMVWQAPRWLLDANGPLAIRPAYLPQAMPWLVRWLLAGRRGPVLQAAVALHDLHRQALTQYRDLLGDGAFADLIRVRGQLHVWSRSGRPSTADRLIDEIRARQGISVSRLDAAAVARRVPGLRTDISQGIGFDNHAHCVNPQRMVQTLVKQFQALGGQLVHERVQRLQPLENTGWRLWTNAGSRDTMRIVLATGAHTQGLLAPLKVSIPMEVERGYHVELPDPGISLSLPFIDKDRAVAVTPMEHGLRFAGTAEFAGLRHPPDPRRTDALLVAARQLFPGIRTGGARTWLGYRPSTPDSVPIIGPVASHPGLLLACGHGHTGLTGSPMTAQLVAYWLQGMPPPIDPSPYRLERFS